MIFWLMYYNTTNDKNLQLLLSVFLTEMDYLGIIIKKIKGSKSSG